MIQQLLLAGQVLVVVLLYVFVWRVMRAARADLSSGLSARAAGASLSAQESTIMPADEADRARRAAGLAEPRVVVVKSELLRVGVPYGIAQAGLSVGRAADNDVTLDDQTVSSHHVRFVRPATLVDLDSTNGTLVNGRRVTGRVRLKSGDQVTVGATTFRYEVPK